MGPVPNNTAELTLSAGALQVGPEGMRAGELLLTLDWSITWRHGWRNDYPLPLPLPGQNSRAGPGGVGASELAPRAQEQDNWPLTVGELVHWSDAGKLVLVVSMRESWKAEQLSYHPGPSNQRTRAISWPAPTSMTSIWSAGACEGTRLSDP